MNDRQKNVGRVSVSVTRQVHGKSVDVTDNVGLRLSPNPTYEANETLFKGRAGTLTADKQIEVVNVIVEMLRAEV